MLRDFLLFLVAVLLIGVLPNLPAGSKWTPPTADEVPALTGVFCTGELEGPPHSTIEDLHGTIKPDGTFVGWLTYLELNGTKPHPLGVTGWVKITPDGYAASFRYRDEDAPNYKNQRILVEGVSLSYLTGIKQGFPESDSIDWLLLTDRYPQDTATLRCAAK